MYPEGQHILVVDNDAQRLQMSVRVLTEEGFAVTAVTEGFSAIRAANGRRFALAVAALRLPGALDGTQTLRHLRARQPSLRALYTGGPTERAAWTGHERDDFIAAPFRRHELLGCVFELLQRGQALDQAGRHGSGRLG